MVSNDTVVTEGRERHGHSPGEEALDQENCPWSNAIYTLLLARGDNLMIRSWASSSFFTVRNEVAKVIFLQVCIRGKVPGPGGTPRGGLLLGVWSRGVCPRGDAWSWGVPDPGGVIWYPSMHWGRPPLGETATALCWRKLNSWQQMNYFFKWIISFTNRNLKCQTVCGIIWYKKQPGDSARSLRYYGNMYWQGKSSARFISQTLKVSSVLLPDKHRSVRNPPAKLIVKYGSDLLYLQRELSYCTWKLGLQRNISGLNILRALQKIVQSAFFAKRNTFLQMIKIFLKAHHIHNMET